MNGMEISRPRMRAPIPLDRELRAMVRSRDPEHRCDVESDDVLTRFIDWAMDDDGDGEPGDVDVTPDGSLLVFPPS